jgi:hypothetical protein
MLFQYLLRVWIDFAKGYRFKTSPLQAKTEAANA